MDSVSVNPPELQWSDLDREWSEFWTSLAAHTQDHALWFTPARATYLQSLLARSSQWRQQFESHNDAASANTRSLYAAHLRRLRPLLLDLQRGLTEIAEQLLRQRETIRTKREWARQQARTQTRPPAQLRPAARR